VPRLFASQLALPTLLQGDAPVDSVLFEAVEGEPDFPDNILGVALPEQVTFQDPATEIMLKIIELHNDIMFYIVIIVGFVSMVLAELLDRFAASTKKTPLYAFSHHTPIEII